MKTSLVVLLTLLGISLKAQQLTTPDSIALRYARNGPLPGEAVPSNDTATYYLVKFRSDPGNTVQQYGVIRSISPLHYILRQGQFTAVQQQGIAYCYPANNNWKASEKLLQQIAVMQQHDSVALIILTDPAHLSVLSALPCCRIKMRTDAVATAVIQKKDWPLFIAQTAVLFADIPRKAVTEIIINTADPTANAITAVQQKYPSVSGKRITISVKENLFDTTDADLTGRYIPTDRAVAQTSVHAAIMATMMAGAGNSGIKGLGAAPAALLASTDFNNLLPEPAAYFQQYGISIQNHSYGTDIENYYGIEAAAYDELIYTTDTLLHVFSSGNIGTQPATAGIYQGLSGFANLSGTFKQAKNVLVTGGTDDSLQVLPLSSKGPAYDGRIKPEITAFGEDGTSGAAAVTSGVAALLQEAYHQKYHAAPAAALLKALLINSAVKTGHVPVSYGGGFGSLDALSAMRMLQDGHFIHGSVAASSIQHFTVTVPPGMQQLQVTLCWNDPPATVNTNNALVNDLDLSLTDAHGQSYAPWVLNTFPALDSLQLPPHRGRDSLNNVEQVTIDNPSAGPLQISISSRALATASQSFYVVYHWTPNRYFEWQNPAGKVIFTAGTTLPLRWQSNVTGKGDLSYSLDSGITWQSITQQLPAEQKLYYWAVPDTFAAALLRYRTADTTFISDTFYLSPRLTLQTGYDCTDSAFIFWESQPSASGYQLYRLGEQYLTPYRQTTDTFLVIPAQPAGSPYFAVSALHHHGWAGLKSDGVNYKLQSTGCYFQQLLANITTDNNVQLSLTLGTTFRVKQISWQRQVKDSFITLSATTANTGNSYTYLDNNAPEGILYYRAGLLLENGNSIYSMPSSVYLLRNNTVWLFPNPVHNTLYVLNKATAPLQLHIYDMNGRLLLQKMMNNPLEAFPMQDLPAGIYHCVVYEKGRKVFSGKVVKM